MNGWCTDGPPDAAAKRECRGIADGHAGSFADFAVPAGTVRSTGMSTLPPLCLLYTSDAADEL